VVVGEPGGGLVVDHSGLAKVCHLAVAEAEVADLLDQPVGAGHHAVPPADRQPPGEHLEDRPAVGRAVLEGGTEHGQLVVVGQQRRREAHQPTLKRG
jgi:hypothetical protein